MDPTCRYCGGIGKGLCRDQLEALQCGNYPANRSKAIAEYKTMVVSLGLTSEQLSILRQIEVNSRDMPCYYRSSLEAIIGIAKES